MKRTPRAHGFTLLELLFSMAVGTTILLAAAAFLGSSMDDYGRLERDAADEREARRLLDMIGSEIASAVFHRDMRMERGGSRWPVAHLGFFTLRPADAQSENRHIGDLCAVSYHVEDLTVSGRTVRCVTRGFRDSGETFDSLRDNTAKGLFETNRETDEPIATRVVSFDAIPLVMDASGHWTEASMPLVSAPEAIRIRLVIANPSLAAGLTAPGDWDGVTSSASRNLGEPSEAEHNAGLQVFESTFPFRHP